MGIADTEQRTMLMRARETSALTGIPVATLYQEAAAGNVPSLKIGKAVWFPRAAIERWIEDRARQGRGDDDRAA